MIQFEAKKLNEILVVLANVLLQGQKDGRDSKIFKNMPENLLL